MHPAPWGRPPEGFYRLPSDAEGIRPRNLERLFDCLENTLRRSAEGCEERLALAAMILHLNDDHQWTRERISAWVAPSPDKKPEGVARPAS